MDITKLFTLYYSMNGGGWMIFFCSSYLFFCHLNFFFIFSIRYKLLQYYVYYYRKTSLSLINMCYKYLVLFVMLKGTVPAGNKFVYYTFLCNYA